MPPPVFRFAPSPNGYLHLGHACSALLNAELARRSGGRLLLRIEDIDPARCRPEFELARGAFEAGPASASEEVVARAEHFYRMVVERLEREFDAAQALRSGLGLAGLAQDIAGSA